MEVHRLLIQVLLEWQHKPEYKSGMLLEEFGFFLNLVRQLPVQRVTPATQSLLWVWDKENRRNIMFHPLTLCVTTVHCSFSVISQIRASADLKGVCVFK